MGFAPASKARLTERDLGRFSGGTLFGRVARAVCRAGCLPRKGLCEAWEVGRRTRRLFRGWVNRALAIDIMRAVRLERNGYEVWTQAIPADITPKNRLLLGRPRQDGSGLKRRPPPRVTPVHN